MKFKIKIQKALEVAEKNLQEHIVELKEASDEWTRQVHKAIDNLNEAVTRNGLKASHNDLHNLFYKKPIDNRPNYSRYIGALKLGAENSEFIDMDEDEYDRLFNDNWEWRMSSKLTNSSYSNKG